MITATVSHDMRTPLNTIIGLIHNIESSILDIRAKKLLDIVKNSSKILLYLVNDLLDFFQLKNDKFKINLTPQDVRKPIMEIVDMFQIVATEKNLTLDYHIDEAIPSQLYIDEMRIQQVLINLLSNSMKFTLTGYVSIRIWFNLRKRQLHFEVKDTGVGIKDEDIPKLFTLFGKCDSQD